MGLLSTIAKGAGSLLGGDAIKDIGKIVDDLHTSGEEREEAKQNSLRPSWDGLGRFLKSFFG